MSKETKFVPHHGVKTMLIDNAKEIGPVREMFLKLGYLDVQVPEVYKDEIFRPIGGSIIDGIEDLLGELARKGGVSSKRVVPRSIMLMIERDVVRPDYKTRHKWVQCSVNVEDHGNHTHVIFVLSDIVLSGYDATDALMEWIKSNLRKRSEDFEKSQREIGRSFAAVESIQSEWLFTGSKSVRNLHALRDLDAMLRSEIPLEHPRAVRFSEKIFLDKDE